MVMTGILDFAQMAQQLGLLSNIAHDPITNKNKGMNPLATTEGARPYYGGGGGLPLQGGSARPPATMADKLQQLGYTQPVFHGSQSAPLTESGTRLQARTGGLKLMDGLGPHTGTAEAATARLNSYHGVKASKKNLDPRLSGAFVLPGMAKTSKPFVRKDGNPYTEAELQSRLANIGEKLGYSRSDLRHYSTRYAPPAKFKEAQKAIRDHLQKQGYDSIPYINSHEARGSTSWIHLKPNSVASKITGEMLFGLGGGVTLADILSGALNRQEPMPPM